MQKFRPTDPPKDFDPRLVNILKNLHGYLDQVYAA